MDGHPTAARFDRRYGRCVVKPAERHRQSSWTDGIPYPGRTLREAWGPAGNCLPVSGGLYTACPQEAGLRTSHEWQPVAYAGRTDYVVSLCVIPAG